MPKVIVTGATGYIGSHVVRYLLSQGWEVGIIAQPKFGYGNIIDIKDKLDIFEYMGDINSLMEYFKNANADVVMHLAAAVITNYVPEQIPTLIRSNIEFGTQVLEAMRSSKTRLFITTGSNWQNYNSATYNPVDLYAATKEAFEKIIQLYVDAYDFRSVTLRLFDVYGEDDKRPKLWTLLRNIAENGECLDISRGEQLIDMVHVTDIAKAYEAAYWLLAKNSDLKSHIYGVGTGKFLPLKDIIIRFQQLLKKDINLNWGGRPYKTREVMIPYMGYEPLPNWEASISLEEGLARLANASHSCNIGE